MCETFVSHSQQKGMKQFEEFLVASVIAIVDSKSLLSQDILYLAWTFDCHTKSHDLWHAVSCHFVFSSIFILPGAGGV